MSLIKILVDDTEIDFVKETLNISKENNALIEDFRVSHSSYPFLVVENKSTVLALGPRDITSVNKVKIIPVTVIELGQKYYGELQVLSFISGFRKCNLKYATELLTILDQPINSFMPIVSVIPDETDPETYVEESDTAITGDENWLTYPVPFTNNVYPQVKYQFPTLFWGDFIEFDDEDGTPDEWLNFNFHVNRYQTLEPSLELQFPINTFSIDGSVVTVNNQNIAMPQVFLLSPLFYALETIGFTLGGSFPLNPFIRRILLLSMNQNMTKITIEPDSFTFTLGTNWNYSLNFGVLSNAVKTDIYELESAGDYALRYKFVFDNFPYGHSKLFLSIDDNGSLVFDAGDFEIINDQFVYQGEHTFSIEDNEVGDDVYGMFFNALQINPLISELELVRTDNTTEFRQMHPTIDLSRYVENWNTAEYLNQLKKLFNLDISINDEKKQLLLNFNETFIDEEIPEIIGKSLKITQYDITANTSFLLKYANDEDAALFITRNSTSSSDYTTDQFTKEISSRFKMVPRNGYTSELSEALKDKEGVGLMLYDIPTAPYTSLRYNNKNLSINETDGIYDTYHKKWLKFRLNASSVEMSGPFTEIEVSKFNKAKSIYIDNQHYRIVSLNLKEKRNNIIDVSFSVESVNY